MSQLTFHRYSQLYAKRLPPGSPGLKGEQHVLIIYSLANGQVLGRYVGPVRDGKRHGRGVFVVDEDPSRTKKGVWVDDKIWNMYEPMTECNAHCWLLSSENVEVPTSPRRERAEGSWEVGVLSPRRRGSVMSRASVESSFSVVSSVPSTPR